MRLDKPKDFQDARRHVYGLAHNVALNGIEQKALLNAIQRIERENLGDSNKVIIEKMLVVIMDGLLYGNWPWSSNDANGADRRTREDEREAPQG